jgi:hypothetical protein
MDHMLGDLFGDLLGPAKSLVIALIGLSLAYLLFKHWWDMAFGAVAVTLLIAFGLESIGDYLLPRRPQLGLLFLEAWFFAPAAIAAFASALVVFVAVLLAEPQGASDQTKEIIKTLSAALTAFISGSFVSWISEQNNSKVSNRIKRKFFEKYRRARAWPLPDDGVMYFKPSSVGENLVYSEQYAGMEGWSFQARWERARELNKEIISGNSNPKSAADIGSP